MSVYHILQIRNVRNTTTKQLSRAQIWISDWAPPFSEKMVIVQQCLTILSDVPELWLDSRRDDYVQIITPHGLLVHRFMRAHIGWRDIREWDFDDLNPRYSGGWGPSKALWAPLRLTQ